MTARPDPPPVHPTDRMRARGVQATCWWSARTCRCGGPVATDGTRYWCGGTCEEVLTEEAP